MRNEKKSTGPQVLVAHGDVPYAATLARHLESHGHAVEQCHDAKGVLRLVGRKVFDVIVLDLSLSRQADMELVSFIRRSSARSRLILLFEMTKLDRALEGIRQGAFFYLPETSAPSDVSLVVNKA
ncbi:MAG: response regulator, partial [FCB group bacterium]|nr:response regulator [FCB group bacterium]